MDALRRAIGAPPVFSGSEYALYLYEIPHPNLGQYSPTEIVHATAAADILKAIASTMLDPRRTIVTSEMLPETLVSATLEEFSVGRGDFHIRATSLGQSVLLLPIEYSNCLTLKVAAPGARLFRANLFLTGIIFERAIDARIAYFTGPFSNSACRLLDRKEFARMDIAKAFRDNPEFAPSDDALNQLMLQTMREMASNHEGH